MKTMTLSGWGQPYDALSAIAPDATHIPYANHATVEEALSAIAGEGKRHEMVIGWSLGGQLAVRAIAASMFMPKYLVLIAVPYQFVMTPENPLGMRRDLYDKFRRNVAANPARALGKAWDLIYKDDARAEEVRACLNRQDKRAVLEADWLRWLDALDRFSCDSLTLTGFPPTLIIHGDRDVVVNVEQSKVFAEHMEQAKLVLFKDTGHAVHWHDSAKVKRLIAEHCHV